MRKPIFEVNFYKGEINDSINNIAPTIRGSMPLQTTEKGIAAFTNNNANSLSFVKTLNTTYSVVFFIKHITNALNKYIIDLRLNSGVGYIYIRNDNLLIASGGSVYINNILTNIIIPQKYNCVIVSGINFNSTNIDMFIAAGFGSGFVNAYCPYFAIYSGTLTTQERTQIQNDFNKISNLRVNKIFKPVLSNGIVLNETFEYDKADTTSLTPCDWIKGTGVFKVVQATANSGTIKAKDKYLECVTAGEIAIQSKTAYGTFEFDIYKALDVNSIAIRFIDSTTSAGNRYAVVFNTNEQIGLYRDGTALLLSKTTYAAIQTWYTIKVTNAPITGIKSTYIKGGTFGPNYVLVSTTGGLGTNPVTDNTYTTSNYFVCDLDAGDRIANIKIYNKVI